MQVISRNTKLIPVAPDDILRSYEMKRSVCARNWTLFTMLLPVIQRKYDSLQRTDSSVRVKLFPRFSDCWRNWSTEWFIHHRIRYATILAHFQSEWLSGAWMWVLIEQLINRFDWVIDWVLICSARAANCFRQIWWTDSTSSLKIIGSKEWFICELDMTPDHLSEALDYR